jgi:hypothetical protein
MSAHGLDARRRREQRAEALHPVGLRDGAPDGALVGWHARAEGATAGELSAALVQRRWVAAPAVRGFRVLDAADLATVTIGALPLDDAALAARFRRRSTAQGADVAALLWTGVAAARAELEEGPRSQAELSRVITAALPERASAYCRGCDAVHVDNGLFRVVGLAVAWVRAAGVDDSRFARPDLWSRCIPSPDPASAAAALLAWHLRAHSPTTAGELAGYLGIGRAEAEQRWAAAPPVIEVDYDGRRAQLPVADLDAVRAARLPDGVRLVPPYDSLLDTPDRATLVPDPAQQREVWRVTANPGVALVDGAVSCAWRATRTGGRLDVRLLPLDGWHAAQLGRVREELATVAALRGAELGSVESS